MNAGDFVELQARMGLFELVNPEHPSIDQCPIALVKGSEQAVCFSLEVIRRGYLTAQKVGTCHLVKSLTILRSVCHRRLFGHIISINLRHSQKEKRP
jgi:hypothetical protein